MSNENMNQGVPVFEPPADPVPTFAPPADAVPVFTPPADAVPTFAPPAAPAFTGPSCHFHPGEPAVKRCAKCGKPICQDCFDNYQVADGTYKGRALCYDCCQELVADNVAQLTANMKTIKFQFILSLIGIGIGFIFGFAAGIQESFFGALFAGLLYGCIGGVFLSAVKAYFVAIWEALKLCFSGEGGWIAAIIFLLIRSIVIGVQCIWQTIKNTIEYITYLKRTQGFIEADTAALQQMKDYMEYTLIRNQNQGIDIATLLRQESRLADNAYAQMVNSQGEEQAEAFLRGCTASINERGEIIRSFGN